MDIRDLFQRAIGLGASDVLLTAGSPPVFRVDGEVRPQGDQPVSDDLARQMIHSLLSKEQVQRLTEFRELDFGFEAHGWRFRGNAFFTRRGIGANYRLLSNTIPTLQELALPGTLAEIAMEHSGLVLVTGPTGHGKSTTLAAMVDIINRSRRAHVVTVEDPIEYVHENRLSVIDQREVGSDTLSFAGALRHVLRQNPDVILIGEMRDLETISLAITAAETGHLVMSTLHTVNAAQTVGRMIDVFPPNQQEQIRAQLSLCLIAVLAQRLLPRKTGRGRVVGTELLRRTHALGTMIRDGNTHQIYSLLETNAKLGLHTMDSSIKRLYLEGLISLETAREHIRDSRMLPARE